MPTNTPKPHVSGGQAFRTYATAYATAGFRRYILPVIPPDAAVSHASKKPEAILASRGKIPGKLTEDGWVGFGNWPQHVTTKEEMEAWAHWPCGVGLLGRDLPAVDIDVVDPDAADAIERLASEILGRAPCRSAGAARRLLVYRGQHRKRRLAFSLPGSSEVQAIELLGDGQFYVVEGIHKSGRPYSWRSGRSPAVEGIDGLAIITAAKLDEFFDKAEALLKRQFGAAITARDTRNSGRAPGEKSITPAPSLAALRAAIDAIPNDDEITYDTWIKIGMAIHAASDGSEEGYAIFEDWSLDYGGDNTPDAIRDKWDSFKPEATGWNFLQRFARKFGFNGAVWEFDVEHNEEAGSHSQRAAREDRAASEAELFEHCVWVERLQAVMDLRTYDRLNREQLNARFYLVGDPSDSKKCAWAKFLKQGHRRRTVKSVTYRPGSPQIVHEPTEGGECVNIWRPTNYALPKYAHEDDAKPWLDHLAFLLPDERERHLLVMWFAWVIQNPEKKPNWGVLLGSQHQGNGKSIITKPLRAALGDHNVREITAEDLASGYTDWLEQTKVFIVEEMHSFERTSAMNRVKNFLALPPYTLRVNPKFGKQYEVPNIMAGLFFTNHRNALALERTDRRFLVLWTDAPPRPERYYLDFLAWYEAGGAERVARYLLDLDLGDFSAQGRAPETPAKTEMRHEGRSRLEEWIEDGLLEGAEFGKGPFGPDLIALDDLRYSIPEDVCGKAGRPSPKRFASALRAAGAEGVERVALGPAPRGVVPPHADLHQARLYALRNVDRYVSMERSELVRAYWEQRLRAQGGPVDLNRTFAA